MYSYDLHLTGFMTHSRLKVLFNDGLEGEGKLDCRDIMFEILITLTIKFNVLRDVTPCFLVRIYELSDEPTVSIFQVE